MRVDGTWELTIDTPMGAQKGNLSLTSDGDSLTGKMTGGPGGELDIEDGKVDGNDISYKFNITSPMAIAVEVTATVDGDNISGSAKLGAFGTAKITGARA